MDIAAEAGWMTPGPGPPTPGPGSSSRWAGGRLWAILPPAHPIDPKQHKAVRVKPNH
jgi:hypothetical protein